jgi:hypothetical protein
MLSWKGSVLLWNLVSYVIVCALIAEHWAVSVFVCLSLCYWRDSPQWARASSFTRLLYHTQRRATIGRTPLDEWSARRRGLYLTTHNTHNRQTSMPPVGAAADLRLRLRGHWERRSFCYLYEFLKEGVNVSSMCFGKLKRMGWMLVYVIVTCY